MRALIRAVRAVEALPLVGDSPGVSSTRKAAEKCGLLRVCQEEAAELLDFNESMEVSTRRGGSTDVHDFMPGAIFQFNEN